jgi:ubiquitin-protein ligase E3 C
VLLPAAAADPAVLSQGKLATELGRTYFLANITTFGITGGMLARYGVEGANTWVKVVATLLAGVEEGWGKWAEGIVEEEDEETLDESMDVDDSEDEQPPAKSTVIVPAKKRRQVRRPLPTNISSKLLLLGSTVHIATLADLLVSSASRSSANALVEFSGFTINLLHAFRGSPRWETILDGLLEGKKGMALTKRLWREGVRGQWGTGRDAAGWREFTSSKLRVSRFSHSTKADVEDPAMSCLVLMTHLYCHYLLLTPDDEFFAQTNSTNPLSLDEVLELGAIWRDLAFWGYMLGVSPSPDYKRAGDEDTRTLLTKGVTRLAARK